VIRKIFYFLLIVALSGCGYESIYFNNNKLNLPIKEFELTGDKNVNRKIISILNLKKDNSKNTNYVLRLDSQKLLETAAKDKAGNATIFKTSLKIKIQLTKNGKLINEKTFDDSFTYSNSEDKFNLSQYQKSIEENLIDKISEKIIFFLSNRI
jgi:hypothetical protein|tara:strand:- start:22 stop:480 length:459 start_codon:yes stop_codon:yes gene_type:complete